MPTGPSPGASLPLGQWIGLGGHGILAPIRAPGLWRPLAFFCGRSLMACASPMHMGALTEVPSTHSPFAARGLVRDSRGLTPSEVRSCRSRAPGGACNIHIPLANTGQGHEEGRSTVCTCIGHILFFKERCWHVAFESTSGS